MRQASDKAGLRDFLRRRIPECLRIIHAAIDTLQTWEALDDALALDDQKACGWCLTQHRVRQSPGDDPRLGIAELPWPRDAGQLTRSTRATGVPLTVATRKLFRYITQRRLAQLAHRLGGKPPLRRASRCRYQGTRRGGPFRPAPSTLLLAIMSGFERRGRWSVPKRMTTFAVFGGALVGRPDHPGAAGVNVDLSGVGVVSTCAQSVNGEASWRALLANPRLFAGGQRRCQAQETPPHSVSGQRLNRKSGGLVNEAARFVEAPDYPVPLDDSSPPLIPSFLRNDP